MFLVRESRCEGKAFRSGFSGRKTQFLEENLEARRIQISLHIGENMRASNVIRSLTIVAILVGLLMLSVSVAAAQGPDCDEHPDNPNCGGDPGGGSGGTNPDQGNDEGPVDPCVAQGNCGQGDHGQGNPGNPGQGSQHANCNAAQGEVDPDCADEPGDDDVVGDDDAGDDGDTDTPENPQTPQDPGLPQPPGEPAAVPEEPPTGFGDWLAVLSAYSTQIGIAGAGLTGLGFGGYKLLRRK